MKFWDTSAVVPLCVQEPDSTVVREILVGDASMVVWWGTRTECVSALMRRMREGGLTHGDQGAARHVLRSLADAWMEIQPQETLRSIAERLLAVHSLRTADALQLAAAMVWCRHVPAGQDFVTFDRRLRDAGYREGFTVLPETRERGAGRGAVTRVLGPPAAGFTP